MAFTPTDYVSAPLTIDNPRMRIVCFPHSGHAKTAYSALAVWLSEHKIEVITVSAPRSEDQHGEAPAIDWRVLIDKTCEALKDCGLIDSVPYAFFGHSLGAVLAYSVAVQLDRDLAPGHARPLHIFASSHGPPWTAGPARRGASDGHTVWTSFTNVSDYELLFTLAKFGHFPEQVTSQDEFLTVVFPALRADFQVYETHEFEAGRPPPVPITVVDFSENWAVPMELLSCWVDGRDNSKFTTGHFFIASCLSEFVSTVVSHLKESISALRPPASTSQYQIQARDPEAHKQLLVAIVETHRRGFNAEDTWFPGTMLAPPPLSGPKEALPAHLWPDELLKTARGVDVVYNSLSNSILTR